MALSRSTSCCHALSTIPHLNISYPHTASYNSSLAAYWASEEGTIFPSCIVHPTTTSDVSDIVSSLTKNDASCPFAIKGQGHSPSAGFANIQAPGVTIDMSSMKTVTVNNDKSIAHVGAGASWLDVYAYLHPFERTVNGGRNGQVGVGGLTLGGGIGYFGPQVGWTCDTLKNVEIVLALGRVVNANDKVNQDLFKALKGGGNNFGVVTRFDFKTIKVGEILGGTVINDFKYRERLFKALVGIADAKDYDVHASIVMAVLFASQTKKFTILSTPIYTEPVTNPPVYKELFAVPNITSSVQLRNISTFANESAYLQLYNLFYESTYSPSLELLNRIFDVFNSSLYNFEVADKTLSWSIVLEPLPQVFASRGAGQNVLGTSAADGNGLVNFFSASWTDSAVSAQVKKKGDQVMAQMDAVAEKMGLKHRYIYANYANANQKVYQSYGSANKAFLEKTSEKYDPSGVFQKLVPGGFKLKE